VTGSAHARFPVLPADAGVIAERVLSDHRRVLLLGAPGTGKSTLAAALARHLGRRTGPCRCISADPGSPAFGVPGTVGIGRWDGTQWRLEDLEALCTLDAGRFRLPLVAAVRRLAAHVSTAALLLDGPGVVRGVAAAELLDGLVEAAAIEAVVLLARADAVPLEAELHALGRPVFLVAAAPEARRPGKARRARDRTAAWDACLAQAAAQVLDLEHVPVTGTAPPADAPGAWQGRQIALLDGARTVALGEVTALDGSRLAARLTASPVTGATLVVRDAQRLADGLLGSAAPFAPERLGYLAPPPPQDRETYARTSGPRPVGRVGALDVDLVNGVFGDPLLHVRLRHQRRSLLFDLGEGGRLAARIAHQVSDVFISHAHVDHIGGFLWLLRARIGESGLCRLYGTPGLAGHIAGFLRGIRWDRVGGRGPRFMVTELHGERVRSFALQAGQHDCRLAGERPASGGLLLQEESFRVRAAVLEHREPVLAFTLEPAVELHVRKDRLRARGLAPGPWLAELKRQVQVDALQVPILLPDGRREPVGVLARDLLLSAPGKKLTYATDLADSEANRERLIALARGSHTFFCEASFLERDRHLAERTAHLTARACGEIAALAGVSRLVPFHFSRRYQHDPQPLYEEVADACGRVAVPPMLAAD